MILSGSDAYDVAQYYEHSISIEESKGNVFNLLLWTHMHMFLDRKFAYASTSAIFF